jgi:multidrug resistance efflux pump
MTARSFSDRLHLVELSQERTEREHVRTLEELRRTTEQTEALISDKRSSDRVLRDTERAVLALDRRVTSLAAHHGETLSVLRDMADELRAQRAAVEALGTGLASTRTAASEARSKASGAHKIALTAAAAPLDAAEARALRAEMYRSFRGHVPTLTRVAVGVVVVLLGAAAAWVQSCSPGGF